MGPYIPKISQNIRIDTRMKEVHPNPFEITKAVDFTDQEIHDYWVDMPKSAFEEMLQPRSPMPRIILGGKGSGKTHLMRHFSYSLQKIRHSKEIANGIKSDGYIGIYFLCSGLNAGRFSGKTHPPDEWASVFEYYIELWLAQLLLRIITDAFSTHPEFNGIEHGICEGILGLFDVELAERPSTLTDVESTLRELQREVDLAVNNCALTGELEVDVKATRGSFTFGIPQVVSKCFPFLEDVRFLYLIDELENLSLQQQKYINTLIRDKVPPSSFRIGARLYGIKTFKTYSDDEENRMGSEYEMVQMDELLRKHPRRYRTFSRKLIAKRLSEAGFVIDSSTKFAKSGLDYASPQSQDQKLAKLRWIINPLNL